MKILIINTHDIYGGAARAAFRLHESLLQNNIDSQMLVMNKQSDEKSIITLRRNKQRKRNTRDQSPVKKYKQMKNSKWGPFSPAKIRNEKLIKTINSINPDIVHLHWICQGMVAVEDLAKIKAPIVWSLHDMWAFTGGCHYVGGFDAMCDKYIVQCQKCDVLGSNKIRDLSFNILKRKKKIFEKISQMTIVGLSGWLAGCAKKSAVFASKNVINLPNPINTCLFKPLSKEVARKMWNLPEDKNLILFGAMSATTTPYKGYDLLVEALNKISGKNIEFVVFGSSEPIDPPKLSCKANYLGNLHDDVSLASLYSACDVMVVPSRRENLSNAIMESLSCGTPVIGFDIGGNSDMIDHQKNGYLAQPFDTSDLAKGIDWTLNNENYDELCKTAREKIINEFDYSVVAESYINLYNEILSDYSGSTLK
ncbi:MAG: glycosyltransferase family 4 protein [Bacteroidales bacterium]|nr:glycosyltransferase family 4 protein [Bacteroidales bacterium]